MSATELLAIVAASVTGVLFVTLTGLALLDEGRRFRLVRRFGRRTRVAERAAFEASLEDPAFDPAVIRAAIGARLAAIAEVWAGGDPAPLGTELDRWRRRVETMVAAEDRHVRGASVALIEVVNREGDDEDRVVATVQVEVRGGSVVASRWTLARAGGDWVVSDIADAAWTEAALSGPLIPGPWADVDRLRTETTLELAAADALPTDSVDPALVDTSRPPADALAELALVDARFGTHVLDRVVRRLATAWEAAATGQPAQLSALASREAASAILHPADVPGAHLVVHHLGVTSWTPSRLHAGEPTRLDLAVQLEGIRYVTAPGEGALLAGSQHARHPIDLTWTLTLVADPALVWRLDGWLSD